MKLRDKLSKTWNDYAKPAGMGISSFVFTVLPGCGADVPAPEYSLPKTTINDNYSNINSVHVVESLKEDIKNVKLGYDYIEDRSINKDWESIVDQELNAIDKATSLAVRSIIEKEKHDYEYPASKEDRRDYLDRRLNALLYKQNEATGNVLDSLKIDPMLQTIMKNDSVSIGDYIDSKNQFLEYRINFLEGGEHKATDNGKMYIEPRKIRFSIYNWDKNALGVNGPSSSKPQLGLSKDLELDFENNNYTFRDVMKLALEK